MKIINSILACGAITLLLASCRKSDIMDEQAVPVPGQTVAGNEWQTASWQSAKGKNKFVNYFEISDPQLANAGEGMVIVYKKSGNNERALPFEENIGGSPVYWYYQVSGSNITIHRQGNNPGSQSQDLFSHLIINAENFEALKAKGYTYEKLMVLSRESILALLK